MVEGAAPTERTAEAEEVFRERVMWSNVELVDLSKGLTKRRLRMLLSWRGKWKRTILRGEDPGGGRRRGGVEPVRKPVRTR